MELVYQAELEDIYMNYTQQLTFDKAFTRPIVDQLSKNIQYIIDDAHSRVLFKYDEDNYTITGYLSSARITVKTQRRLAADICRQFIEKVAML